MRKIILVAHISLDGFVAGKNGELDGFDAGEENLEFVCKICQYADTALLGRVSYQLLDKYWPTAKDNPAATKGETAYSNWYNNALKIVVSKTLHNEDKHNTTIINNNIVNEISTLKNQNGKDILIFGSPDLAHLLMRQNLIDNYWIFINPKIFGKGIPLFKDLNEKTNLQLLAMQSFSNGEIALHYDRI